MASAQSPQSNLACSKTVYVAFSCLCLGGYPTSTLVLNVTGQLTLSVQNVLPVLRAIQIQPPVENPVLTKPEVLPIV
jgi:hypothetical protein